MYDDQNHTANVKVIATDITQEMIESELQNKEKWHIGPEHFLTKWKAVSGKAAHSQW